MFLTIQPEGIQRAQRREWESRGAREDGKTGRREWGRRRIHKGCRCEVLRSVAKQSEAIPCGARLLL